MILWIMTKKHGRMLSTQDVKVLIIITNKSYSKYEGSNQNLKKKI